MDLRQVVATHPEKHIAHHRGQGFNETHLPGQRQQQDRRQQQVGHQQPQDQPQGAADQQVGGHGAHLPHQFLAQLLKEKASQEAKEGAKTAQYPAQTLQVGDLHQQPFRQQVHPQPAGGGAGDQKQNQDQRVDHQALGIQQKAKGPMGRLP